MIERTEMYILLLLNTLFNELGIRWMGCKGEVDQLPHMHSSTKGKLNM